ncbi:COX15/CtaA family protein [Phototrophicus methaneseepsis]|uniref:COX15/CtaA family protein n=1 Tax=Phototrophicus methaneseepsis TaxID=2710758 RepID=A0A7S8E5Q7_9CHLR|nr:COX15/CtaA family protein [Phototrophicus methaneseepsis]QPC80798.1 COX15/CtaA family protein [Phototrophicus methaneseepsis]
MIANNVKHQHQRGVRTFTILALLTAILTVGLIIFGAVVRVTDSGLGCGSSWPLCDGHVLPPLDNVTAWIEWLHRLFAALIGLFGLATLFVAWRSYRQSDGRVFWLTVAAAVLFVVQSLLGAIVVIFELPPTFVTLHLGTAMLLLGSLLAAAVVAWYRPHLQGRSDNVRSLAYLNAVFSLVIILTGALVRGSGATLACTEWPLCFDNVLLPVDAGQLAVIHMIHRFAVAALGLSLLILVWQVIRQRRDSLVRGLAVGAFVAYLAQAGVGAMYVISVAGPGWGAAHVGLASLTWALLVALCMIESLEASSEDVNKQLEPQWQS